MGVLCRLEESYNFLASTVVTAEDDNALIGEQVNDDTESQPDVRQRKPGEDQREDVVLVVPA